MIFDLFVILGLSKNQAKNNAAESALRHYVKTKNMTDIKKIDIQEGDEKMDTSEEDNQTPPLPWQHVASFAIYKLLSSWGDDPNVVKVS